MKCIGIALVIGWLHCEDPPPPPPPPAVVCPSVRAWSKDFQKKVAAELRAVPKSALAEVATQSIGDRDIARACATAEPIDIKPKEKKQ
jgi:hypothetical protein